MAKRTGYIKLFRSLAKSEMWTKEKFTRGQAWVDLLLLANFAPGHIRVRGNKIDIGRGQVGRSIESLAERWMWSKGKVKRFLEELEMERQVERQKSFVSTVLTITNYDRYQGNGTADGSAEKQTDSKTFGSCSENGSKMEPKTVQQTGQQKHDASTFAATTSVIDCPETDGRQTSRQTSRRTADRPADGSADGSLYKKKERRNKEQQQQLKTGAPDVGAEPPSTTWEEVVVVLKSLGVEMAEQAVATAKRNSNTPRDVMSLVEHYQRNEHDPAFHPGILKNKVCSIYEGGKVSWPKSAVIDRQVAAAKSADKIREQLESRRKHQEVRKSAAAERAAMEEKFGEELDAMSKEKLREFVESRLTPMMIGFLPNNYPVDGPLRTACLLELSSAAKQPTLVSEAHDAR